MLRQRSCCVLMDFNLRRKQKSVISLMVISNWYHLVVGIVEPNPFEIEDWLAFDDNIV